MSNHHEGDGRGLTRAEFLKLSAGSLAAGAAMLALPPFPAFAAEAPMITRKIPKTGEALPIVGFGTAQDFGDADDAKVFASRKAVIETFLQGGGAVIDTSPTYSDAESVVGRALADLGMRNKAFIATKISTTGEQAGVDQYHQSVRDLKTATIDLLQIHNLRDAQTHLKTVERLKAEGKVRYIGATHFMARAHERLVAFMKEAPLDFVQVNYSMVSREAANTVLPAAKDLGMAVIINLPFARGRVFRQVRGKKLPEWAAEFDADSWGKFFLKFVLANDAVTAALPGTTKVSHEKDNLGAGRGRLPDAAQLKRMIAFFDNA